MNICEIFKFGAFFKFLKRNMLYTFIEIFGLSVSLTFVILIAGFTIRELSTDDFQQNKNRLYLLSNRETFGFAYRLAERIKERYPEIEAVCPIISYYKKSPVKITDKSMNVDLLFVDSTFFGMLSFTVTEGERTSPLAARNHVVISESFARRAFPDKDPLGQFLQLNDSVTVTVNAVMKDIRNSTIPYGDILVRIDNIRYWNEAISSDTYTNYGMVPILVQAVPGANLKAKEKDLLAYLKENVWVYKRNMHTDVSFTPIKEAYFSDVKGRDGLLLKQGDKTFVLILLSVSILILLFAIINYINLTVAQTGFRAKEMATRRLLGSSRGELFARLILESSLLTFLCFGIALFLAHLFVPSAGKLLETQIELSALFRPAYIPGISVVLIVIGGIAGLLPALIISNAQPIEVVRGNFRRKTKALFSRVFITFQNIITLALVTASLIMAMQIRHLIKAPLGYHTHHLIDVETMNVDNKQTILTLGNELKQLASVKQVAFCQGMPFSMGNNYSYNKDGRNISFQSFVGDSAYFRMLGFEILRENNAASGNAFYLSQKALKELELDEDSVSFNLEPFFKGSLPIAGVVKDFQVHNIVFEPRPTLLRMKKIEDFHPWNIVIETNGDPYTAFNDIKKVYEDVTGMEFVGNFVDKQIADSFAQQRKTSAIVILFAFIALLLSSLGLIAMSTYFIQQRSREIALRKVFGSSTPEVLRMLIFNFLYYIIIAFVITTPAMWYIMQRWLSGYASRIALSPWIFVGSGLFCLFVSFMAVFLQSYRAACTNPIRSIKTE